MCPSTNGHRQWVFEKAPLQRAVKHSLDEYPHEACGILFCSLDNANLIVDTLPVRNATSEDPVNRYTVDPQQLFDAYEMGEKRGMDVCGFYHSHPDHSALPSETDRSQAWEGYLYLIFSVQGGNIWHVRAWTLAADKKDFNEEELLLPSSLKQGGAL